MAKKTSTGSAQGEKFSPVAKVAGSHHSENYLFAFTTLPDISTFIRTQVIPQDQAGFTSLKAAWEKIQPAIAKLYESERGLPDSIARANIPEDIHEKVREIIAGELFQKTFTGPFSIEMVEIDKLVAPQRTVNLDFVKDLTREIGAKPDATGLVDFCLGSGRKKAPVAHLEIGPNQHAFTSVNTDLRFLGGFLKPLAEEDAKLASLGGMPVAAVIGFVGYGLDAVNVLAAGKRYVLNNGFHRVYTLRTLGVKMVPVVVQHKANIALEFPQSVLGIPREYLLNHPRPVLMKDFFVENFNARLRVKDRLKTITTQIQSGQIDIPI
ncbi:MAG: hypothetical protein V3R20_03115 [Sphingomonadales bacterium]